MTKLTNEVLGLLEKQSKKLELSEKVLIKSGMLSINIKFLSNLKSYASDQSEKSTDFVIIDTKKKLVSVVTKEGELISDRDFNYFT